MHALATDLGHSKNTRRAKIQGQRYESKSKVLYNTSITPPGDFNQDGEKSEEKKYRKKSRKHGNIERENKFGNYLEPKERFQKYLKSILDFM